MSGIEVLEENKVIIKQVASEEEKNRIEKMKAVKAHGSVLGVMSLVLGIIYAVCLYKNSFGITYPLFVISAFVILSMVLIKLKIQIKRESLLISGAAVLIGISTCLTGDYFLIGLNKIAVFLLMCIFMLHQFYDDRLWNLEKYVKSLLVFIVTSISLLFYPFKHLYEYLAKFKEGRSRSVFMILFGVGCSLPVIMILVILLCQADMVFGHMMEKIFTSYFKPRTLIGMTAKTVFGAVACYCLVSAAYIKNMSEDITDRRKQEPLIAISGLVIIALVYLVFSGIQIVYLFMRSGNLPEGVSFSSYAREGFFQLLFVVCFNLSIVLLSLKFFKPHWILNGVLTLISICTYIMIASAAYRMFLYVGEYQLTYLRVLVLWFLALLAVLMAGVIILIHRNSFPLFRYGLVVVSLFYLILSFGRPDFVIASYNTAHMDQSNFFGYEYLETLSVDAVPVLLSNKNPVPMDSQWKTSYYTYYVETYYKSMGIRKFNFSYAKAGHLLASEKQE